MSDMESPDVDPAVPELVPDLPAAECIPSEEWWFYDLATGVCALGSMLLPHEAAAAANTPPGFGATRIVIDPYTQRFDPATMEVLPFTPPGPDDELLAEMAREARRADAIDELGARARDRLRPAGAAGVARLLAGASRCACSGRVPACHRLADSTGSLTTILCGSFSLSFRKPV